MVNALLPPRARPHQGHRELGRRGRGWVGGGHLLKHHFPQDISAQPYPQVSRKTGSQPQHAQPAPAELELDLTQTSGQTFPGPSPYQSGRLSAASVRPPLLTEPTPCDPPANASLPASRGSDPQGRADAVWSPRLSRQHSAQQSPAGPGLSWFSACSRLQASQDQGLGHLLSLPPNPRLLGATPGSAREMPVLQEKALPHSLCILSLAEARATGQHQEGPGRKRRAYIQSLHVGYKKEPSLRPPGQPSS